MAIGIEATNNTTHIPIVSKISFPFDNTTIKMIITKTSEVTIKKKVTLNNTFWKFPTLFTCETKAEVLPKKVLAPVAQTIASS